MRTVSPPRVTLKRSSASRRRARRRRPGAPGSRRRRRRRRGRGQRPVVGVAVHGQVGRQRLRLPAVLEVGEDTVGPASGSVSRTRQTPSPPSSGCRCWKPCPSRRTTIRCMRFSCSTSKSRTGRPSEPTMRSSARPRVRAAARSAQHELRPPSETASPRTGSAAPCRAVGGHPTSPCRGGRAVALRPDGAAGGDGAAEHEQQQGGKARELGGRAHAVACPRAAAHRAGVSSRRSSIATSMLGSITTCSMASSVPMSPSARSTAVR